MSTSVTVDAVVGRWLSISAEASNSAFTGSSTAAGMQSCPGVSED